MKYFVFRRESNKFQDILNDVSIKKHYKTKMTFNNHLILGFNDEGVEKTTSYILLKYGEDMIDFDKLVPDRSPIPGTDYVPIKKHFS